MKRPTPKRRAHVAPGKILYLSKWADVHGADHFRWTPSPRLRKLGHVSTDLGTDHAAALARAIAINAAIIDEDVGRTANPAAAAIIAAAGRTHSFDDLLHNFRTLIDGRVDRRDMSPKTHREYRTQLKWLRAWANDGALPLRELTADMCQDLRDTLVAHTSPYVAAARLRMLRQLLGHAVKPLRILPANPMDGVPIPTPPARTKRISIETMETLVAFADARGAPNLALAILLGFFTTQREGDLLGANRMCWRLIEDVSSFDRITLSAGGAAPMGLRILQSKTKTWVTNFLPADIAARLTAKIAAMGDGWDGHLLQSDDQVSAPAPRTWAAHMFQRAFRAMVNDALADAAQRGDEWVTDQLTGLQYRDLRRSGMCWLRDAGTTIAQIAAISGHSITYTQNILDTYMPSDPRGAAAGIAGALRNRAAQKKSMGEQT